MEVALTSSRFQLRCYWRQTILIAWGSLIAGVFWFASRYPALLAKSQHLGAALPTMAYDHAVVGSGTTLGSQLFASSANWLLAMAIGMSFGVAFGALLHTWLRYYPLRIGKSLVLNSLQGALIGAPMGVCANCSVPMACGITRGHGRVEIALGYLFSSPNFNPVVVTMTLAAFPLYLSLTKYAVLVSVILVLVPLLVHVLERRRDFDVLTVGDGEARALPSRASADCDERFADVVPELARAYARNVWMLLKPTLTIMMLASVLAALALTLVPWAALLSTVTWPRAAVASFLGVVMPVPIALDVMFAAQMQGSGIASGYVMLFLMTLGTYSIVPSIYLWREVSRRLSVLLFVFFWLVGFVAALAF